MKVQMSNRNPKYCFNFALNVQMLKINSGHGIMGIEAGTELWDITIIFTVLINVILPFKCL